MRLLLPSPSLSTSDAIGQRVEIVSLSLSLSLSLFQVQTRLCFPRIGPAEDETRFWRKLAAMWHVHTPDCLVLHQQKWNIATSFICGILVNTTACIIVYLSYNPYQISMETSTHAASEPYLWILFKPDHLVIIFLYPATWTQATLCIVLFSATRTHAILWMYSLC